MRKSEWSQQLLSLTKNMIFLTNLNLVVTIKNIDLVTNFPQFKITCIETMPI